MNEVNPLKHILYRKNSKPTQPTQPSQLGRKNESFWMSPNIARGFRSYSRFTNQPVGVCVEEALIEYMQNHPVQQVSLSVIRDLRSIVPSLQTRLRTKILKRRIRHVLNILTRLEQNSTGNPDEFRRQLHKLVLQATKIRSPEPSLLELLGEAEDHI